MTIGAVKKLLQKLRSKQAPSLHKGARFAPDACFHAEHGQDKFVYHRFFKGKRNGVFVDVGAWDGVEINNTYFFERELDRTGLCIEPQRGPFKRLAKNRRCTSIQGCIAAEEGKQQFLHTKGSDMWAGLIENYDSHHFKWISAEMRLEGKGRAMQMQEVNCYRLPDLLRQHRIKQVDFLSIDIEGGEFGVLQTLDFKEVPVHVMAVEVLISNPELRIFLEQQGFEFVERLCCDEIYVNSSY